MGSVLGALASGRAAAKRLMTDQVRVTRFTGEVTVYGLEARRESTLIYEGRGKLQSYEGYEQDRVVAGASLTITRTRLDIPVGDWGLQPGDQVVVLKSVDPGLIGKEYRVASLAPFKTHATAYRVFVDEETRG
ncbi:DUF6093 family protein [Actinotignum schaalii]|uniref:DUF6093 family protein n=1 Tax=Actinotignum TaxID=1653174 RepID=UPI00237D49B6|nr:DUF6093 family protein [Actinotignum sanguinis]MDE1552223.1 DUF6093 family protein [Actinotignum sanguinis]